MKKNIIVALLIITGIALILYPFISNFINEVNQTQMIVNYQTKVEILSDELKKNKIKKAEEYNNELEKDVHIDVSLDEDEKKETPSYLNLLDVGDTIGYINIPKIDVSLPIYHGTSNNVLKSGVGHLESSSLPVGGKGTHAVLAGHTGLASGKIFDNIDKLEIGDLFYINVLDKTLEYKVDNIITVTPDNANAIKVDPQKDYVTLVTCTPKFVNSHRLLVRGERVQNKEIKAINNETNDKMIVKIGNRIKEFIQENNFKDFYVENKKEVIILGIIFILIGILVWSHKFIKIEDNNKEDKIEEKNRIKDKQVDEVKENTQDRQKIESEEKINKIADKFKRVKTDIFNNEKYRFKVYRTNDINIEQCINYLYKKGLVKRGLNYKNSKYYVFSKNNNFKCILFKKLDKVYLIKYENGCENAYYKDITKYLMKIIYQP